MKNSDYAAHRFLSSAAERRTPRPSSSATPPTSRSSYQLLCQDSTFPPRRNHTPGKRPTTTRHGLLSENRRNQGQAIPSLPPQRADNFSKRKLWLSLPPERKQCKNNGPWRVSPPRCPSWTPADTSPSQKRDTSVSKLSRYKKLPLLTRLWKKSRRRSGQKGSEVGDRSLQAFVEVDPGFPGERPPGEGDLRSPPTGIVRRKGEKLQGGA